MASLTYGRFNFPIMQLSDHAADTRKSHANNGLCHSSILATGRGAVRARWGLGNSDESRSCDDVVDDCRVYAGQADYPDFRCQGVPFDDDLAQSQICADGIQTGSIAIGAGLMQ
jgi:hypothetical protein